MDKEIFSNVLLVASLFIILVIFSLFFYKPASEYIPDREAFNITWIHLDYLKDVVSDCAANHGTLYIIHEPKNSSNIRTVCDASVIR